MPSGFRFRKARHLCCPAGKDVDRHGLVGDAEDSEHEPDLVAALVEREVMEGEGHGAPMAGSTGSSSVRLRAWAQALARFCPAPRASAGTKMWTTHLVGAKRLHSDEDAARRRRRPR